jgi:hypothetical protein
MATSRELTKDFVGEIREVKLKNGLTVKITTPTNRWWFDFLLPKLQELQWSNISEDVQQQIIKEVKKGKLSQGTLTKMPMPLLELFLEFLMYYTQKDRDYIMGQMTLDDDLLIFNTWLQLADAKRMMDFFVKINEQFPMMGILLGRMREG